MYMNFYISPEGIKRLKHMKEYELYDDYATVHTERLCPSDVQITLNADEFEISCERFSENGDYEVSLVK